MIPDLNVNALAHLGPASVGVVFFATGILKAAAPHTFRRHLAALGFIPFRFLSRAVTTVAALEVAWGTVLILGIAAAITLPASLLVLVILSIISWSGVRRGKTADCGCYGGFIQPSIGQSLALNGLFASLILAGWIAAPPDGALVGWRIVLAVGAGALAGVLSDASQRVEARRGHPLFDTNPIKPGRRWNARWSGHVQVNDSGETLVSYLGPECPYCKRWVKLANAMIQSPALPNVIGVVSVNEERLTAFRDDHGIRFPLVRISDSLMARMASAVPTTVLVRDGHIDRIWSGDMPIDFIQRFRKAFFPEPESGQEITDQSAEGGAIA